LYINQQEDLTFTLTGQLLCPSQSYSRNGVVWQNRQVSLKVRRPAKIIGYQAAANEPGYIAAFAKKNLRVSRTGFEAMRKPRRRR
jgi:hypothetical protein